MESGIQAVVVSNNYQKVSSDTLCRASIHGNQSNDRTSTKKVGALAWHGKTALTVLVLGLHTRLFKDVFNRANAELMDVFGMQLVELPKAERVTMRQKRGMSEPLDQPTCLTSPSRRRIRFTEQVE
jgi:hypothetical protein